MYSAVSGLDDDVYIPGQEELTEGVTRIFTESLAIPCKSVIRYLCQGEDTDLSSSSGTRARGSPDDAAEQQGPSLPATV